MRFLIQKFKKFKALIINYIFNLKSNTSPKQKASKNQIMSTVRTTTINREHTAKATQTRNIPREAKISIPRDAMLLGFGGQTDFILPTTIEYFLGYYWDEISCRWIKMPALSGNRYDRLYAAPRGSVVAAYNKRVGLRRIYMPSDQKPTSIQEQMQLPNPEAVVLGYGRTFEVPGDGFYGWTWDVESAMPRWKPYFGDQSHMLMGMWANRLYAAHYDSPVAKMNGLKRIEPTQHTTSEQSVDQGQTSATVGSRPTMFLDVGIPPTLTEQYDVILRPVVGTAIKV